MNMKPFNVILAAAFCASGFAASAAMTKGEHKAALDNAEMSYKSAKAACESFAGNAKDVCIAEAKVEKTFANGKTHSNFKNTPKAQFDAQKDLAGAEYDLAKTKCQTLAGNDKDVCVKEAKAVQTKARVDAQANRQISDARKEGASEKRDADYSVATEKCDALVGTAKSNCIASAKVRFGKS